MYKIIGKKIQEKISSKGRNFVNISLTNSHISFNFIRFKENLESYLYYDKKVSPFIRRVMIILLSFTSKDDLTCFPSYRTITKKFLEFKSYSSAADQERDYKLTLRRVVRAINHLCDLNYITKVKRHRRRGGTVLDPQLYCSNVYRINPTISGGGVDNRKPTLELSLNNNTKEKIFIEKVETQGMNIDEIKQPKGYIEPIPLNKDARISEKEVNARSEQYKISPETVKDAFERFKILNRSFDNTSHNWYFMWINFCLRRKWLDLEQIKLERKERYLKNSFASKNPVKTQKNDSYMMPHHFTIHSNYKYEEITIEEREEVAKMAEELITKRKLN